MPFHHDKESFSDNCRSRIWTIDDQGHHSSVKAGLLPGVFSSSSTNRYKYLVDLQITNMRILISPQTKPLHIFLQVNSKHSPVCCFSGQLNHIQVITTSMLWTIDCSRSCPSSLNLMGVLAFLFTRAHKGKCGRVNASHYSWHQFMLQHAFYRVTPVSNPLILNLIRGLGEVWALFVRRLIPI